MYMYVKTCMLKQSLKQHTDSFSKVVTNYYPNEKENLIHASAHDSGI